MQTVSEPGRGALEGGFPYLFRGKGVEGGLQGGIVEVDHFIKGNLTEIS